MCRVALSLLSMLLPGVHVEAQRMVVPVLPAPPTAKEALFGSIAPDGRAFVYEVVEGDERLLWRLDLGSLRAERLTSAPGVRYHPAWAPDATRLAYWREHPLSRAGDGSEGLYLLDVDSGTERQLAHSEPDDGGFAGDVTWLADGRILYRHMLELPNMAGKPLRFDLVARRSDGAVAQLPPSWIKGSGVVSPSGTKEAYGAPCCGGARQAIWVRDVASTRCVAGPIVLSRESGRSLAWTHDEKRLYLVAHTTGGADTLDHAFAVDLDRGKAWRIGPPGRTVASVSVSDAGDVALTVMSLHGRVGSLWITPASRVRESETHAEQLQHCPPIAKPIVEFVRRDNLRSVHWIAPVYEDSTHGLTVFSVAYGIPCDIYSTRMGLRYGSRIGWIGTADLCQSVTELDSARRFVKWFPLRSTDDYLFSDSLADRIQGVPDVWEFWRFFAVRNPATPFDVIVREVRRDPGRLALVALENPSVTSDTIAFDARLKLAALEDTLAAAMVGLPSVRNDPERLARIADLPMYRWGERLATIRVEQQLRQSMPSMIANVRTISERTALQAFMAAGTPGIDSLRSALLHALPPSQNRVVLALAAMRAWDPNKGDPAYARATLARLGLTPERELLDAIRRVSVGELPESLPRFMLSGAVNIPWPVLDAISRLDERFRQARARAALELVAAPPTPDSVIKAQWEGLSRHRDRALAERFFGRAYWDTSRTLLRAVAELDSNWYASVVLQARKRLAELEPRGPPFVSANRRARLPLQSPVAPDSLANDSWMPTDQCLAPDDWSEQLRRAIGVDARLLAGHSLCIRSAAALDSAFELPVAYDSTYLFGVPDGYVLAFPPARPDADVTLVRFDSAFAERSRSVVRVH